MKLELHICEKINIYIYISEHFFKPSHIICSCSLVNLQQDEDKSGNFWKFCNFHPFYFGDSSPLGISGAVFTRRCHYGLWSLASRLLPAPEQAVLHKVKMEVVSAIKLQNMPLNSSVVFLFKCIEVLHCSLVFPLSFMYVFVPLLFMYSVAVIVVGTIKF